MIGLQPKLLKKLTHFSLKPVMHADIHVLFTALFVCTFATVVQLGNLLYTVPKSIIKHAMQDVHWLIDGIAIL